jgi:hypothetical protein
VRPGFRRFAIVSFVVLTPIALHAAWDHYEARRLARLVADISSRNEPVSIAVDGIPAGSLSNQNAARYYEAAAALVTPDPGLYGPTGLLRRMELAAVADRPRMVGELRAWLERNREAETLLARATDLPFEGYLPGTEYNYRVDRLFKLANLAGLRTFERLQARDGEAAADSVVRQLRIGRPLAVRGTTTLFVLSFTQLLARSLTSIGETIEAEPTDAALQRIQRAVHELDNDRAIEQSMLGERASALGRYWNDAVHWYARQREGGGLERYFVRPFMTRRLIKSVEIMNGLIATARQPWPDRLEVNVPPAPAGVDRASWGSVFASAYYVDYSLRESYRRSASAVASSLALGRTADAAIGVSRYQHATGSLPKALNELVPAYLAAVPVDPFSGGEVRYSKSSDRFVVYSIGSDRKDDGGTRVTEPTWPGGVSRSRNLPPDIGVTVRIQPKER